MKEQEIKALVSLLDDDDKEVSRLVEGEIKRQGEKIIPFLENEWESASFNPAVQRRIEELIHELQYEQTLERLALWHQGGAIDLLEGLWIVATYQYPDLPFEKLKKEFEQFYYETWLEFKVDMHPIDQIRALNHVFFTKLKFGSNTKSFHSAGNSMLNIVLDTRKGNPISLCCIYMIIAQRLNMPVYGVNLPNLFVLTYKQDSIQFYINVFNKGLVFMRSDIDHYIAQLNIKSNETFYQPCSNLDILKRVLRNLALAFEKTGDSDKIKEIERMSAILNEPLEDQTL
ncbi:transglutaminase-like domain-containing protein [Runella zeae]|jgi:regulator of sirC expression with transglutaminase-like and TPR domain|uniref:transglutaminase-like domain-containing protein n=1 Tax=Runella zeae TaxID=94255 RepID=UPI00041A2C18|nr:transglutaminase-like domain-containing protein [Runella zeae]